MKNQAIFSSEDTREKLKCRLLQFLLGALRDESLLITNFINFSRFSTDHLSCHTLKRELTAINILFSMSWKLAFEMSHKGVFPYNTF